MTDLPPAVKDAMDRQIGAVLIAAAVDVQSEQKRRMSQSFPPASRPGQYLRWRTGNAREGVMYDPTDPLTVGRARSVKIGYTAAAWYGGWWEVFGKRLGIVNTIKTLAGRIDKWLAAARRLGA